MDTMTSFLMDTLTDDEWALLKSKITSARIATRIICDTLWNLVDGLSEDWNGEQVPFDAYETAEYFAAYAHDKAVMKLCNRAQSHEDMRSELFDLTSW